MNPKVFGIILLVVGLGVGLYFINSGGAAKFQSIFANTPGSPVATSSSTASSTRTAGSPASSSSTASSSTNPVVAFFEALFSVHSGPPSVPTVGGPGFGGGSVATGGSAGASTNPSPTPPAGFTASQLSPYYQQVHFSGVSTYEISIGTYGNYGTPTGTIDITGWEIKANHGGEFIPQVAEIYNPDGLNTMSDIVLTTNQTNYVNFYANSAPINVRLNECLGYLNTPQQFNPPFPDDCPSDVNRSQISSFTGTCQNYLLSIGSCQAPDRDALFLTHDYQCENYIQNKFTYQSCIMLHATDSGFLSNEWHIWMGSSPIDSYHDNVELLDKNGLLVDYYTY
jgi:hypothetical protein